jgi:hypothetical protein
MVDCPLAVGVGYKLRFEPTMHEFYQQRLAGLWQTKRNHFRSNQSGTRLIAAADPISHQLLLLA